MSKTRAISDPTTRTLQAKAAAAKRWNHDNKDDAARDYAAQRIADYIKQVVDAAPPLTSEQRDKLAALLRPIRVKPVDLAERERHADCANLDTRPAGDAA